MSDFNDMTTETRAIDRDKVEHMLEEVRSIDWSEDGTVHMLVETPRPHRHAVRKQVDVVVGKGFVGDHARKSYFRGEYVPGREVSAIAAEVLDVLDVDPSIIGDNLITRGVHLARLRKGDLVHAGEILLERSHKEHRPCVTFRDRTSPEAFAVVSRDGNRGALFVVREGGVLRTGDEMRVVSRRAQG